MSPSPSTIGGRVLAALYELTRGLRSTSGPSGRTVLPAPVAASDLEAGLVATIVRLVLVLHAQDRGLLGGERLSALADALRADEASAASAPRGSSAWVRITQVFRSIHEEHGGQLFDPRAHSVLAEAAIPDPVIGAVLDHLLVADGERIAYGAIDVEDLGAAVEASIGLTVDVSDEPRLVLRGGRKAGAPAADPAVGMRTLLATPPDRRAEVLSALGIEIGTKSAGALRTAASEPALVAALAGRVSDLEPRLVPPGAPVLQPTEARRRAGAHYTPRALTEPIVMRTLSPLLAALGDEASPEALLDLRIADPAMGCGAFLVAACRVLGARLEEAWRRRGEAPPDAPRAARRLVAQLCLHGVDRDPRAVEVARMSLWLVVESPEQPFTFVDHALRSGDALVGLGRDTAGAHGAALQSPGAAHATIEAAIGRAASLRVEMRSALARADAAGAARLRANAERALRDARRIADAAIDGAAGGSPLEGARPHHWLLEHPEVLAGGRGGFDAFVGNPPWVSYAGRAAQPLDPARRAWLERRYASFAGFKNLQGAFVERCAELLRPGGRLGLVIPSSMSEQAGYAPTRRAHDRLAVCDDELRDVGEDGFPGVFQPCLVLTSTRRSHPAEVEAAAWPVERPDLDRGARALIARMTAGPLLPASLFGERGLQSSGDDLAHLARDPDAAHDVPLRSGGDIRAFSRGRPSFFADHAWFGRRLRTPETWREVRLLIRQTAPYPIATLSDGLGFRNSILAGFGSDAHPPPFLAAWLNSTPIRWLHFVRHRDARQGMPQLKIGHLRVTPAPPGRAAIADLAGLGETLAARNAGLDEQGQAAIDRLVEDAFGLDTADRARIAAWATVHGRDGR